MKFDKGQMGGMNILTSLLISLFICGLLVMVIALTGGKLISAVDDNNSKTAINDTVNAVTSATDYFPTILVIGIIVVIVGLIAVVIVMLRGLGGTAASQ